MDFQNEFDSSVRAIHEEKIYDGFLSLTNLYRQVDKEKQNQIFTLLREVFYLPNQEVLQENYESNCLILKKYPYWFGPEIPEFEQLEVLTFPIDENCCFVYEKATNTFMELEVNSERETKYFFNNLTKPLFVENETNEYNLNFLVDNVRASENVAMDNHIYLYYDKPEILFSTMQFFDMSSQLASEKFVFLVGKINKKNYPINFKKFYNIDYRQMTPKLLGIDEMKRLTINHVYGYTGTQFLCEIMNAHPNVIVLYCWFFHEGMDKRGIYDKYLDFISDEGSTIDYENIIEKIGNELCTFLPPNHHKEFLSILKQVVMNHKEKLSALEWFKAIAIAKHYTENGISYKSSITPIIYFDGHYRGFSQYMRIFQEFSYISALGCIRDPIMRFARSLKNTVRNVEGFLNGLKFLYKEEKYYECVDENKHYIIKLEDMKLNPKESLKGLCKTLNITMDNEMLHPERYQLSCSFRNELGEALKGFDKRSLNRNIDDVVSELDKLRFMLYLSPVSHLFGYDYSMNYDCEEEDTFQTLFNLPYRFENLLSFPNEQARVEFRNNFYKNISPDYFQAKGGKKYFIPQLIQPER